MYVGIGIAVTMALFEVALAMGRSAYLSVADGAGIPHDASVALWRVLTFALARLRRGASSSWGWCIVIIAALIKRASRQHRPRPRSACSGGRVGPRAGRSLGGSVPQGRQHRGPGARASWCSSPGQTPLRWCSSSSPSWWSSWWRRSSSSPRRALSSPVRRRHRRGGSLAGDRRGDLRTEGEDA